MKITGIKEKHHETEGIFRKKSSFILTVMVFLCYFLSGCASSSSKSEVSDISTVVPESNVFSGQDESVSNADTVNGGLLTVQLTFNRTDTMASNQAAVWIENAEGEHMKTLYVSAFTGIGGFARRAESLPVWVSKAHPAEIEASEIDAITSATPQSGVQQYTWDGIDDNGEQVSVGEYRIFVEGTLYWTSSVLYSGSFEWGGNSQVIDITSAYTEADNETNKNMISQVSAEYSTGT